MGPVLQWVLGCSLDMVEKHKMKSRTGWVNCTSWRVGPYLLHHTLSLSFCLRLSLSPHSPVPEQLRRWIFFYIKKSSSDMDADNYRGLKFDSFFYIFYTKLNSVRSIHIIALSCHALSSWIVQKVLWPSRLLRYNCLPVQAFEECPNNKPRHSKYVQYACCPSAASASALLCVGQDGNRSHHVGRWLVI